MSGDDRRAPGRYVDPVDAIWLATAHRLGFAVVRSADAYAAYDGAGTITISDPAGCDPDDSVAGLVLHELCHFLTAGEASRGVRDWGLDNIDPGPGDVRQERACLRLQRALLDGHGLTGLLAPTTPFREFYDGLVAPLDDAPSGGPADPQENACTRAAWALARTPRYATALDDALRATAAVARAARAFAGGSLWATTRPGRAGSPPAHRLGLPLGPTDRRCGGCAWARTDAGGRLRCRLTARGRGPGRCIEADEPACAWFEVELDCGACGACCREAFHELELGPRDPFVRRYPSLVRQAPLALPRPGGYCPLVVREVDTRAWRCADHPQRPRGCRTFEVGGRSCLIARRRLGLSPEPPG